ncbi:MAG: c-type cytochrome biogenesis protein CcmI [Pseudomonadales bacterium]|nr:c-type cytochrome biogenesis protein CcmI [Pseudomonadales bacterium]
MFWLIAVLLILLASLFVLVPLWRLLNKAGTDQSDIQNSVNLGIYRERLEELEQELTQGNLDENQFNTSKHELERLLLVDVSNTDEPASLSATATATAAASWKSPVGLVPLLAVMLLPVLTWVAYEQWGFRTELELRELNNLTLAAQENPEQALSVVYQLTDFIDANRDSGWAWYFLAQNLSVLGQYQEVSVALRRASELIEQDQDKAFLLARLALNDYLLADRKMTPQIQDLIEQVRRLDPAQPYILQILAVEAENQNDPQAAITYWRRLLQLAASSEERDFLQEHIATLQASIAVQGGQEETLSGPVIDVQVSLAPGLELAPQTRVFVSALGADGTGQPLAAKVLTVAELPATVRLDNSSAVGPRNLASADMVYIVATASMSGTANVQAGDYQVRSDGFQHAGTHAIIELEIKDQVQP